MKQTSVIVFMILLSAQTFGETAIDGYQLKNVIAPKQALLDETMKQQKNKIDQKTISIDPLLVPDKNEFSAGRVIKHKLKKHFSNLPIFVVGTDAYSVKWTRENAEYLKKIRAIGILTNFESADDLNTFEQKTGLAVTTTGIQGLSKIIGTTHYPFLIYNNWVIQ